MSDDLDLLKLKIKIAKAKAMAAQQSAPAPVESEPELPEYEGNRVQAFFKSLGSGAMDTVQQLNSKLGIGESLVATGQAGVPYEQRQAVIDAQPEAIRKDRADRDAEYASVKQAFPIAAGSGRFIGEVAPYMAATAPLSAGAAGLNLAGRVGIGALDGAITGALSSEEGKTLEGAGFGAATGGLFPLATAGAGAVGRGVGRGVVKLKDESVELGRRLGRQLPLSMSAADGGWRKLYREGVANVYGGMGAIRGQERAANHALTALEMRHAAPPGVSVTKEWENLTEPQMFDKMYNAWRTAFEPFKALDIDPQKLPQSSFMKKWVRENVNNIDLDNVSKGKQLTLIYERINDAVRKMTPDEYDTVGRRMLDWMDDSKNSVKTNFAPGSPEAKTVDLWRQTTKRWRPWTMLRRAEKMAAPDGKRITVDQAAQATAMTGLSRKEPSLTKLVQRAVTGMEGTANEGLFKELAALGAAGGAIGYATDGPEGVLPMGAKAVAIPVMISALLARPGVQRGLAGNLAVQQQLQRVMNSAAPHAQKFAMARQLLTNAGIVEAQQED